MSAAGGRGAEGEDRHVVAQVALGGAQHRGLDPVRDGVTEVRQGSREVFGLAQLTELLSASAALPPNALADRVEAAVVSASEGRLRDDMAILALGATPGG